MARRNRQRTFTRNSNHAFMRLGTDGICGLCDDKASGFYAWTLSELNVTAEICAELKIPYSNGIVKLCATCDAEEWDSVSSTAPGGNNGGHIVHTSQTFGKPIQTIAPPKTLPPPAPPVVCCKGHFDKIDGPEGYGYLRIASVRARQVDTGADFLLGFDFGWSKLAEPPEITRYNPGGKAEIPQFGDVDVIDRATWPSMAFIDWRDGAAPDDSISACADWTLDQWKAGKNIQFGCFGAHGRTGTFLALLLLRAGFADSAYDAVEQVRTNFICDKAVETPKQVEYLLAEAKRLGMTEPEGKTIVGTKTPTVYNYAKPAGATPASSLWDDVKEGWDAWGM